MADEAIIEAQKNLIEAQQNLISVMNNELAVSGEKTAVSRREMLWEERKETTFSEYVQTFLKGRKSTTKKSTYHNYIWLLNKHIIPDLGDMELCMIDNLCLQEFADKKLQILSKKTVRDLVGLVKNILNDAYINEITEPKKFIIKYPKSENSDYRTLSEDEFKKLEDHLFSQNKPHAIGELIMLETGMRIGEMCGLKWEDINIADRTIRISRTVQRIYDSERQKSELNIGSTKTIKSERIVPVNVRFGKYLKQHEQNAEIYIASGKKTPTEPRSQRAYHARVLKRVGIEYIPPHGLRHTFATRAIQHGVDPKTVSAILGHNNSNVTLNIYTSVTDDMLRRGIEKMFDL